MPFMNLEQLYKIESSNKCPEHYILTFYNLEILYLDSEQPFAGLPL